MQHANEKKKAGYVGMKPHGLLRLQRRLGCHTKSKYGSPWLVWTRPVTRLEFVIDERSGPYSFTCHVTSYGGCPKRWRCYNASWEVIPIHIVMGRSVHKSPELLYTF